MKRLILIPLLAFAFSGCDDQLTRPDIDSSSLAIQLSEAATEATASGDLTPFQRSILEWTAERRAQGLPVPSEVSFDNDDAGALLEVQGGGSLAVQRAPGNQVTLTSTTIIRFDNPAQAGRERWPDIVLERETPHGIIKEDYTQQYMDDREKQDPGIWDQYEYGEEPRTYRFERDITITYPDTQREEVLRVAEAFSAGTVSDEILMGFTLPGWSYHDSWGGSINFGPLPPFGRWGAKVTVDLGFEFGVRLPMEIGLTGPETMAEGSAFSSLSTAKGVDWEAVDYAQVGVQPHDGNEFVLFAGAQATVDIWAVARVCCNPFGPAVSGSQSFATPFGPGAVFDLPSLPLNIVSVDIAVAAVSVDLTFTPQVGSDKYEANWYASGDGDGSGSLTYTDPALPVTLGPVLATDGPGSADLQLNDFRYAFTNFYLATHLCFEGYVWPWEGGIWCPEIYTFDLSELFGGLDMGVHSGTPNTLGLSVPVTNVAPTAVIARTETVPVNGTPTFMAHPGETLIFTGRATDPGADDLVLSWNWDDGPPSPDMISAPYPTPYDVTETQSHAFGGACLYSVEFTAVDDDGGVGKDHVPVIITEVGNRARSEGYWQQQFSGTGRTDFEPAALECFLAMVDHMSGVFGEERGISGLQAAHDVLFLGRNGGSAVEQLDRELLVAWLNFASGATSYWQELETGQGGATALFADVVATAEEVRMDPGSTTQEIKEQTSILHHVRQMAR